MIRRLIEKVLSKTLSLVRKKDNKINSLQKGESTILLEGTEIKFTTSKEDRDYVNIGEKCLIKSTFLFETHRGKITIGNNVHIGGAFMICRSEIIIKDDVLMAWGITLYDHNSHSVEWYHRKKDNENCYNDYINHNGNNIVNKDWSNVIDKPIIIEEKAWIGFNVTILKGVTIGEGAVVGACSVVVNDVEPWTVVGGNPAVIIKRLK
ncbi:acyltransferase [Chitinophagaceae bacterium LWZ2-11]